MPSIEDFPPESLPWYTVTIASLLPCTNIKRLSFSQTHTSVSDWCDVQCGHHTNRKQNCTNCLVSAVFFFCRPTAPYDCLPGFSWQWRKKGVRHTDFYSSLPYLTPCISDHHRIVPQYGTPSPCFQVLSMYVSLNTSFISALIRKKVAISLPF